MVVQCQFSVCLWCSVLPLASCLLFATSACSRVLEQYAPAIVVLAMLQRLTHSLAEVHVAGSWYTVGVVQSVQLWMGKGVVHTASQRSALPSVSVIINLATIRWHSSPFLLRGSVRGRGMWRTLQPACRCVANGVVWWVACAWFHRISGNLHLIYSHLLAVIESIILLLPADFLVSSYRWQ